MSPEEIKGFFEDFVAKEDAALAANKPAAVYPNKWHIVDEHLSKAQKLLAPQTFERLLFHLLRFGKLPRAEVKKCYPVLEKAYRDVCPLMYRLTNEFDGAKLPHFVGVFVFGFDGIIDVARNEGFEDYIKFEKAYQQFSKYVAMPYMFAKPERFLPFAQDQRIVERITATLVGLDFIHDDFYRPGADYYSYTYLPFWGAVFTLLLSDAPAAAATLARFEAKSDLPARDKQMETLARYRNAVIEYRAAANK